MTLAEKILDFVGKARTKVRLLQAELIAQFSYTGYQTQESDSLILKIGETNNFIKLLTQEDQGGFSEKEASDLIDFFIKWLELNKVIAVNYDLYSMPIEAGTLIIPPGSYATAIDLAAEIVARTQADIALNNRIDDLLASLPVGSIFPENFFANYNATYSVVFDDDLRLHNHANLSDLDQINTSDIDNIKGLSAHYDSVGDPGGLHVSQDDRDRWDAGGSGGTSTLFKEQIFVANGSTSAFIVTNGVIGQLQAVFVNGVKQTLGTDFSLVDNTIDFGTNLTSGFRVSVCYFEGLSIGAPGGGGGGVYDLTSPTTIAVGGMPSGSLLTGRTWQSIIEEISVEVILPTFSAFDLTDLTSVIEVGVALSGNKTFTWNTTTPANVKPNTVAIRDVTTNILIASGLSNDGSQVVDIGAITNSAPITHSWKAEAENIENNVFSSSPDAVSSLYPLFYGKVASGGAAPGASRPVANQVLIDSGTKEVVNSNGTININFNSASDDYIWFAIPQISASKLSWFIDALNTAAIGGAVSPGGNLFPDPEIVEVDSPTALWTNVNYKIYISNYQTAISLIMQLRNV